LSYSWQPSAPPTIGHNPAAGGLVPQPHPRRDGRTAPLQPWARALVDHRHASGLAREPYTRCKPAGGPRQFMSPYGLEIVDMPQLEGVYVFNISNAQSFRVIYMDGRGHPANLTRNYFGHSTGRWEGDTLVIDTVGFRERFWMNRDGLPHTSQLHLIERLTRVDFDNWNYLTSAIVP
jgi:hypothetical protein